jgi:hypothetical protein
MRYLTIILLALITLSCGERYVAPDKIIYSGTIEDWKGNPVIGQRVFIYRYESSLAGAGREIDPVISTVNDSDSFYIEFPYVSYADGTNIELLVDLNKLFPGQNYQREDGTPSGTIIGDFTVFFEDSNLPRIPQTLHPGESYMNMRLVIEDTLNWAYLPSDLIKRDIFDEYFKD